MTPAESTPTFLIYCIFSLAVIGITIFQWGKKTPGNGKWLVWTGILALLMGAGLDSGLLLKEAFQIKVWKAGWIWPRDENGAITVGVWQDSLSLAMSTLSALIVSAILLNKEIIQLEAHTEKVYAALAMSTAGVVLSWNALTPWTAFAGLVMTIIGGFAAFASRWDTHREANVAARFGWERSFGFLLAFFGACILATSRTALTLNDLGGWIANGENLAPTWIGSCLLVAGLFIQMQPFPFLGWIVAGSEVSLPLRILLNQIFPAWAAFPLLLRLHPQLQNLGLFPAFGWIALTSSILIIFSGIFQKHWRVGIGNWLAAAFSLSCAILAFSGPVAALALFIGVSLGALGLSAGAVALERKCGENNTHKNRAMGVRVALTFAVASGTGIIGFVSAAGGVRWLMDAVNLPGIVAPFIFVFFFFVLLGWKLAWQVIRQQKVTDISWVSIFSLFCWNILSLGVVWTGTVTGETLIGHPDQVVGSLFAIFFGENAVEFRSASDFLSASGLYWGAMILAFIAAIWMSGRGGERWVALEALMPRASRFFADGYRIDNVVKRIEKGAVWIGDGAGKLVDQKFWSEWLPNCLSFGIKTISRMITEFDLKFVSILERSLRSVVEIPAKGLQFIQTGDVRWYLFLALSSGFALLLHFLIA